MKFDSYTIVLLVRNSTGPKLEVDEANAMQDRHLAHLADAGHLLAAGPLRDDKYAGLSILNVPPEEALALKVPDPSVRAGLYVLRLDALASARRRDRLSADALPAIDRRSIGLTCGTNHVDPVGLIRQPARKRWRKPAVTRHRHSSRPWNAAFHVL